MYSLLANCVTEQDIDYNGNDVNNGNSNRHSDVDGCRSSCHDIRAPYFTYQATTNKACWCKNTDAGRRSEAGPVSGNTACKNFKVPDL